MKVLLLVVMMSSTATAVAQGCYATPEAAAHAAIGSVAAAGASLAGFRVEDVQFDSVMRRAWVRVRRCDAPEVPAVLVPLTAPAAALPAVQPALMTSSAQPEKALTPVAVHAGDTVRVVMASSAVHMELQGKVTLQAALGDSVEVALERRPGAAMDEPVHRMRGVLRAPDTVEVQP